MNAAQVGAYLAPLGAVAVFGFLWWRRQQWPAWFVAAAYFGALLFPVLGFFNIYFFRYSFVGDHFQYRTILADNPQAWLAHNNFAELLEQRGQEAEAAAHYQTALRLNPKFAEAATQLPPQSILHKATKETRSADTSESLFPLFSSVRIPTNLVLSFAPFRVLFLR